MTDQPLTYDSDRLIREWRDRYTDRRTVARQMLDEAEVLVRDAIAREREQERREAKTEREYDLERREWKAESADRWHQQQVDQLRREVAEAKERIASLSPRATLMREERETVEDGTIVRLLAPTVPSYGDNTSVRPWMLGELEDVIHRLRMAGGAEQTEVRFKRDAIEACVPFAEFALTPLSPERPAPLPDRTRSEAGLRMRLHPVAFVAVVVVLAALLGLLVEVVL